ncbi:helix-turn-helix domain-containing protein [Rhizobium sp. Leaf383]|uniref:helix-turn-helix domain-containing protein n=1 Tax=Rhizobium sp. Leaf383 TaxID=1736357 RepID=UPI000715E4D1|nr:helix-turn-helix domain-containing protein [Rhizobium sp. Leaf383]KQS86956.1 hypothetical protein ASG58_01550 [Rhizobium sp. Leaf383]
MEAELDVKKLRDKLGMTQAQLASEVGVDQSTVSLWETRQSKPRGPALKVLTIISRSNEAALAPGGVE